MRLTASVLWDSKGESKKILHRQYKHQNHEISIYIYKYINIKNNFFCNHWRVKSYAFLHSMIKICQKLCFPIKNGAQGRLSPVSIDLYKYKKLWRRKCVRRAIFRNAEGATLTLFATHLTVSLCDLSGVILHQK